MTERTVCYQTRQNLMTSWLREHSGTCDKIMPVCTSCQTMWSGFGNAGTYSCALLWKIMHASCRFQHADRRHTTHHPTRRHPLSDLIIHHDRDVGKARPCCIALLQNEHAQPGVVKCTPVMYWHSDTLQCNADITRSIFSQILTKDNP